MLQATCLVIKMSLLFAVMGRPSAELHLTFHIGKQRQKQGFATVWGEPFTKIQRNWQRIKSQNRLVWRGPLEVVWYNFKVGSR